MGHLYRFRKGWQKEHLAKYILSKFSFVAEPSTISDDLGSDFFCTLFKIIKKDELLPQNSFAVQIKSAKSIVKNKSRIEITKKMEYLSNLEIPFFVGVVDDNLKLTIYSGECISNFFTHMGNPSNNHKIFIELVEERGSYPMYDLKYNRYSLKFPKLVQIDAAFDYTKNPKKIDILFEVCRFIQTNISLRKNNEHIYERFNDSWVDIFAGNGSLKPARINFLKRLAEIFYNLEWMYKNVRPEFKQAIIAEFDLYAILYNSLKTTYSQLPHYLTSCYDRTEKLIKQP